MKPIAYWATAAAVSGVLAVCVVAADGSDGDTTPRLAAEVPTDSDNKKGTVEKLERSDAEWRKILSAEEYRILRDKGTEAPGSGALLHNKDVGTYKCAGCDLPLFLSDGKYESGCGWPSFFKPLEGAHITETKDETLGMVRTEITCSRCGGHLGHVFNDGPAPTGIRYCVNSVSIAFDKQEGEPEEDSDDGDDSK